MSSISPYLRSSLPTQQNLAIGYITGTGLAILLSLTIHIFIIHALIPIAQIISASIFSISLLYIAYNLTSLKIEGAYVWDIAIWCSLGIGFLAAINLFFIFLFSLSEVSYSTYLIVNNVSIGALSGFVVGKSRDIKKENEKVKRLNQGRSVLNRVLRHDIRNKTGVIIGYADMLTDDYPGSEKYGKPIKKKSQEIARLSQKAREVEDVIHRKELDNKPINLTKIIEDKAKQMREEYPEAEIVTDIPEEAYAQANELIDIAIENVIENAVKHNNTEFPEVKIKVTDGGRYGTIQMEISDNGPGIPKEERRLLKNGGIEETQLEHSDGMGLWLINWIIDLCDGNVSFSYNEPKGSTVTIELRQTRNKNTMYPDSFL